MKPVYFWCNIVTPHWLHTLSALSRELRSEVHVFANTLDPLEERRSFGWGAVNTFPGVICRIKTAEMLQTVNEWESGYHLITNPFNDPYNNRLVSILRAHRIAYGFQQSMPGLIAGRFGRFVRYFGYAPLFGGKINAADYVLCHGEMCRRYLRRVGGNPARLFLSGYFVPRATDLPARAKRQSGAPLKVAYVGQFIDRKAVLPLARAIARLPSTTNLRLDFIGAGEQLGALTSIHSSNWGKVLPPARHAEVIPLLRTYDVLVLPSRADEWGVVVNEAIHAGCGIVVTENCGSADLVRHTNCGVVVKDADDCCRALVRAAAQPDKVDEWQRAAEALSPAITPEAGSRYLARIIKGKDQSEGAEALTPPWAELSSPRPLVMAMVYHFFAHYRMPIIRELKGQRGIALDCYGDETSERVDRTILPITTRQFPDLLVTPVWTWGQMLWQRKMILPLIRRRYDVYVFLASPYFLSTWVAVLLLRMLRRRVLFWGHLRYNRTDTWSTRFLRERFYKLADGWLSYGHRAKQELIEHGVPGGSVHVIYNSLDYAKHLALRRQVNSPAPVSRLPIFICVSRLVKKRRLDQLFTASAQLKNIGRPVELLLVGEGPEREALEALAEKLQIGVTFLGACYDESTLREHYRAAIATVAPGEVGLTAIQSLSFGVPVITHDDASGQMPEAEAIVDGITGWLFHRNDIRSLQHAMEKALASDIDRMRSSCYQMIDRFFNPGKQVQVIKRASLELAADESDWLNFKKSLNSDAKIQSAS
jgi:glycosyltransferase involved in cell wall biosynthesis